MKIHFGPDGINVDPEGEGIQFGDRPVKPRKPRKQRTRTQLLVGNLLLTLLVALVKYYIELPAINLKNPSFYGYFLFLSAFYCVISLLRGVGLEAISNPKELWKSVKDTCFVPAVICAALIALFLIGNLISAPIFRAKAYSELLHTESSSFTEDIDEISFDQIPMLDSTSANNLANRKLGELSDLVSQFEVNGVSYQINYNDHPVRVTFLNYGDFFKWLKNRSNGIPAYMVVDMVSQDVSVQRLGEGIRYSPSEYFFRFTDRYLRFKYPTLMFDDVNFEIDEEGKPWWVASVLTKRIGLFGGEDIIGAVLLDAVTGESTYYAAEDIPTWVDRAFTADLLTKQYDYYGLYHNGFINSLFTQSGCTRCTTGYNYIAQDDDVWVYTGITSVGGDESNIGFILVNQRTKEAKYYAIAGAEEYSAMSSAEGAVQQYHYVSTFPLLLNIEGQPTYFMALKDAHSLVKMYAMVNVQQYQIVATGTTVAETQQNYLQALKKNKLVDEISEILPAPVADTVSVEGTVEELRSAVIEGYTHFYLSVDGQWYELSVKDAPIAAIISVNDVVRLAVTEESSGALRTAVAAELIGREDIPVPELPVAEPEAEEAESIPEAPAA